MVSWKIDFDHLLQDKLTNSEKGFVNFLFQKIALNACAATVLRWHINFEEDNQMNSIQKSESIKASLRDGFRTGTSKLTQRRCYGYDVDANGELAVNSDEVTVVRWIFDRYISGNSLGKITSGLKEHGIPSPAGKPTWNRETISKLLSNEKYTGRVLLQKTISMGNSQIKNNGRMARYLITGAHAAIISSKDFAISSPNLM